MNAPILEWQRVDVDTERAKVIGGWLVRTHSNRTSFAPTPMAMCFVPDEGHYWGGQS